MEIAPFFVFIFRIMTLLELGTWLILFLRRWEKYQFCGMEMFLRISPITN